MKKFIFFVLVTALFMLSCSDRSSSPTLFNPKNLRTQHFKINPATDTILFGFRGGIFGIVRGSFEGDDPVDIEIKEAYSPAEIVYAGLVTESDGRLLESGGMIYFNAKRNGKDIKLLKAASISIPANYRNKDMKMFKGEETADGVINWKDPEPLDSSINASSVDSGRILFEQSCASCHSFYKDLTGPSLAFVEERVNDRNVLKAFIRNPVATMAENAYFHCQKETYGSIMQPFPNLPDHDIDLILDYIKNESEKRPDLRPEYEAAEGGYHIKKDSTLSACLSAPCGFDTLYVDTTRYEYVSDNMMDLHAEATKEDSMDYLYKKPDSLEKAMRSNGFIDIMQTKGRYNFRIKTLGWFNVDAFYEGMKGTTIVDLFVKTDFAEKNELEVHVFFPAKKILTVGTWHSEDGLFHFEKYKGQIPLFLHDQAVAIGFTSIKEKVYYGISSFKVTKQQTINLDIKESSMEELSESFKRMNLDGIDLDIITKKRLIIPRNCSGKTDTTASK